MSIMTIDAQTHHIILTSTIIRYIKRGMTYTQASQRAQELMENSFAIADPTPADELDQKESGIYG